MFLGLKINTWTHSGFLRPKVEMIKRKTVET